MFSRPRTRAGGPARRAALSSMSGTKLTTLCYHTCKKCLLFLLCIPCLFLNRLGYIVEYLLSIVAYIVYSVLNCLSCDRLYQNKGDALPSRWDKAQQCGARLCCCCECNSAVDFYNGV